jgi:MoaA/NifB/PqqE/SkfB family radical SAM enzyme
MNKYTVEKTLEELPNFEVGANLDITYRCNNNCLHCWLAPPSGETDLSDKELSFEEIRDLADQAARYGYRDWGISGGEPMLRPDFPEIFDYLSALGTYGLNTNGTLIDPKLAKLLRRRGAKMIALYGATPEVHDRVTRNPGSHEATLRGMNYLKEAGAGFMVQIVPLQENYHQMREMEAIADSFSVPYKLGASWIYSNAYGDADRNRTIHQQRLAPACAAELDICLPSDYDGNRPKAATPLPDRLFKTCIEKGWHLHIDPYGQASFCCFIKDPALRYDLRAGSFPEFRNVFLPGIADTVRGGREYSENCGSCDLRDDCKWCPSYAYLESGRYSAKIDYLCEIAREDRRLKMEWVQDHRRYYSQGGVTLQVDSDLPFLENTYGPNVRPFEISAPGEDIIHIRHHFGVPSPSAEELGDPIYDQAPWKIYRRGDSLVYISEDVVWMECNEAYTQIDVYRSNTDAFNHGDVETVFMIATDGVVLSQVFALRQAIAVHSSACILDGKGFLFVGHSEAGKSTSMKLVKGQAEILNDERNVIRKEPAGIRLYGTWSHGELPIVSPNSAPLKAICFLSQAKNNLAVPVEKNVAFRRLVPCIVKPLESKQWWTHTLQTLEAIVNEVPCYLLEFDKSGKMVEVLRAL